MESLFLLDASGFIYRSYFAIQGMSSRQGEATNALYGFIRSFFKLQHEFQFKHCCAIFDGEHSKQARTKLYSAYKAHREVTPPDLIMQMLEAEQFCHLMGIPTLALKGVEADDSIASVVEWGKHHAKKIFICTQDKDMAQLVDDKVNLLNQHKENLIIDPKKVEEIWGVRPDQIGDYLAIIGDSSDNIPGISGFGPKTAVQLLKQYGTLEKILAHAHEIGGKKEETLIQQKEDAFLWRKLVGLIYDLDIPKETEFYQLKNPNWEKVGAFFKEKDFVSLLKMVPHAEVKSTTKYHIIKTENELEELLKKLENKKSICVDTETTAEHPLRADLVGVGLGADVEDVYYVPVNGEIPKEKILRSLKSLFESPHHSFYGHNIKYDYHILLNEQITIKHIDFDTILASYILHAHQRRHSLDELTLEYFGKKKIATTDLIGTGKKQITMAQVPIDRVGQYCCEDVEYTLKLKILLEKELKSRGLESLFYDIELPLIPVLATIERNGMYVDVPFLHTLSGEVAHEIAKLEKEIFHLAGHEFNLNSPKQLSEVLYNELQIPSAKKGKMATSTSADILESLVAAHPICKKILEYRSFEKLRSTYIDTLPSEVNPKTGRIHCQFSQSTAATGRLSCQDPNLQNIPVRTPLGQKIRHAFCPQNPDWKYLSFDYSQIELRLLAHFTEDEGLLSAFEQGVDIHTYTASQLFGVTMDKVTDEMRRKAKVVNFGIVYGQQAFGLSQELLISMKDAADFIDAYYKRYPRVKNFVEHVKHLARQTGKAVTMTGRERLIPEINSTNQTLRAQAERLAINTPLQGTAADLIKIAMLRVDEWMRHEKIQTKMIMQIHDELLFEAPQDEISLLEKKIPYFMENIFELKVPLIVQISVGKNWQEC